MSVLRYLLILAASTVACATAQETYAGYTGYWVDTVATAYSPHDPIDGDYHATKGKWRWITADGKTDVRETPYGVAVPNVGGKPWLPYGTQVIIPHGNGYLDNSRPTDRVFRVDDTGSTIGKLHRKTGTPHIDLRFMTNVWARKWSNKPVRIFVITGVAVVTEDYKLDPFYDPGIAKN
jgi:3D (Asp-Asp-Asp) domain-containing protein